MDNPPDVISNDKPDLSPEIQIVCIFCQKIYGEYAELKIHIETEHENVSKEFRDKTKPCYVLLNAIEQNDGENQSWVQVRREYMQKINVNEGYCILRKKSGYNEDCNSINKAISNGIRPSTHTSHIDNSSEESEQILDCIAVSDNEDMKIPSSADQQIKNELIRMDSKLMDGTFFKLAPMQNYAEENTQLAMCVLCPPNLKYLLKIGNFISKFTKHVELTHGKEFALKLNKHIGLKTVEGDDTALDLPADPLGMELLEKYDNDSFKAKNKTADELFNIYADDLSDGPDYAYDYIDSDSDNEILKDNYCKEYPEVSSISYRKNHKVNRQLNTDVSEDSDDEDMTDWNYHKMSFGFQTFTGISTPLVDLKKEDDIEEIVGSFIGNDILRYISTEINQYYAENQKYELKKYTFMGVAMLKKWFALAILMGLMKKTRIEDYWTKHPLIETPVFARTMSLSRFRRIARYLHFCSNTAIPPGADRILKVQRLSEYFSEKFKGNFSPGREIYIDEVLIPWRGRSNLKTNDPHKSAKHGVVFQMICDSFSGYVLNFILHSYFKKKTAENVMNLSSGHFDKWHCLFVKNSNISISLAKKLYSKKVKVCGKINIHPRLSHIFTDNTFARKGNLFIQTYKRKGIDSGMISTVHNATVIKANKSCVQKDYKKSKKGWLHGNRHLNLFPIDCKLKKWSSRVAMHLINCALFNSFCLYQNLNNYDVNVSYEVFLVKLASIWLKTKNNNVPEGKTIPVAIRSSPNVAPIASNFDKRSQVPWTEPGKSLNRVRHELVPISEFGSTVTKCLVCVTNLLNISTNLWCEICQVPLHPGECFKLYHKHRYTNNNGMLERLSPTSTTVVRILLK